MTSGIGAAAAALTGAVLVLLLALTLIRLFAGARRRLRAELKPKIEHALGTFLAFEDGTPPAVAPFGPARAVFRDVALDALSELRGRERDRLARLLEESGIVGDAVVALGSRKARERRAATDALALIRSPPAEAALESVLADRDGFVRIGAARALAELGGERAGEDVAAAVEDVRPDCLGAAADALLALCARRPEDLGRFLAAGHLPEVQALAVSVTGELRLIEHAAALRTLLDSPADEVAARAARGLGLIGDVLATEPLAEVVGDVGRSALVREAASTALGAIGAPGAADVLEQQLYVGEWQLRKSAAAGLGALGESGAQALRRAVDSGREDVRVHARVALEEVQA